MDRLKYIHHSVGRTTIKIVNIKNDSVRGSKTRLRTFARISQSCGERFKVFTNRRYQSKVLTVIFRSDSFPEEPRQTPSFLNGPYLAFQFNYACGGGDHSRTRFLLLRFESSNFILKIFLCLRWSLSLFGEQFIDSLFCYFDLCQRLVRSIESTTKNDCDAGDYPC